jgi:hypothetical protein
LRKFDTATLRAIRRLLGCITCAALLLGIAPARADNSFQFLPELDAFLKVDDVVRVYLYTTVTYSRPTGSGDSLSSADGEAGAHIDYTLAPAFRRQLREEDWHRDRYLWLRAGYNRARSLGDGETDSRFRENRGVFELNARTLPLAWEIDLYGRARVDLRERNDDWSRRYRLRLGAERMFDVDGRVVVPYAEVEALYDTRYNAWSQWRYKAGAELELTRSWRIEPYFLLTTNSRPEHSTARAIGLALKFYR